MDTQLSQEIKRALSTMRRQNREIRKLILKEDGMKVISVPGSLKVLNSTLERLTNI